MDTYILLTASGRWSKGRDERHASRLICCSKANNNIIKKKLVLVSSYKTCFNINSKCIRIKYKYHYFNRNVRVIRREKQRRRWAALNKHQHACVRLGMQCMQDLMLCV